MLTGKYWITPKGVVDVTTSEHALYARKRMLRLPPEDLRYGISDMFSALTPMEVRHFRRRGVSDRALRFLGTENDPRVYVIRHWRWVRTRGCKFYLWRLDDRTLVLIQDAADYWRAQTELGRYDMVDVLELANGEEYAVPVRRLRDGLTINLVDTSLPEG